MDQVAAKAGVGKMTVYRRWPNKAALAMDALLEIIGPETEFPAGKTIVARIQRQLLLQAEFFNGEYGQIIRALIGEAQFDAELEEAFLERWLMPRREMTRKVFELGVESGELSIAKGGFDIAIDSLYGPFYYRLLLKSGRMDSKFTNEVLENWLEAFGC